MLGGLVVLAVGVVEALALELGTDSSVFDVEDERAIGRVAEVPVPTVFPCGFFAWYCVCWVGAWGRSSSGNVVDGAERVLEESSLTIIDDGFDLCPDILPNLVKRLLPFDQLGSKPIHVFLDTKLVVASRMPEMQPRRNGQVGSGAECQLSEHALPPRRSVRDKETRFRRVVDSSSGVYQFAHLEDCGPHGTLSTRDGRATVSVVEQFVRDECAAESE